MLDLDDKNFSDDARLYFRTWGTAEVTDATQRDHFTGRVNAINAILEDNCERLKGTLAESGLSTAHDFKILQFTHIPYNRFAKDKSSLKPTSTSNFLEIATKRNAKKCMEYLKPYTPEKKKRKFFRRK